MSPRHKNIALVVGFILTLLLAYQFAISKTLDLKNEVSSMSGEALKFQSLPQMQANLYQQGIFLDSVLATNNIKDISIQNNLLEYLNSRSEELPIAISNFSEPHIYSDDDAPKTSYAFLLKGDYFSILETIYQLEQEYNFGSVKHVSFEKKFDYRKRKNFLECSIIIESFNSI